MSPSNRIISPTSSLWPTLTSSYMAAPAMSQAVTTEKNKWVFGNLRFCEQLQVTEISDQSSNTPLSHIKKNKTPAMKHTYSFTKICIFSRWYTGKQKKSVRLKLIHFIYIIHMKIIFKNSEVLYGKPLPSSTETKFWPTEVAIKQEMMDLGTIKKFLNQS